MDEVLLMAVTEAADPNKDARFSAAIFQHQHLFQDIGGVDRWKAELQRLMRVFNGSAKVIDPEVVPFIRLAGGGDRELSDAQEEAQRELKERALGS